MADAQASLTEIASRAFLEHASDGVFVTDDEYRILLTNRRFASLLGRSHAEILASHAWDWDVKFPTRAALAKAWGALPSGQGRLETRIGRRDGTSFVALITVRVDESSGQRLRIHTCRDISEQLPWEDEPGAGRELYRLMFERSTVGMALTSPDGVLQRVNDAMAKMLGYAVDELQGQDFAEITHPDDRYASQECRRNLLNGRQDSFTLRKRYLHKNGDVIHAMVTAMLVRHPDRTPRHFVTQIVDITEQQRADTDNAALRAQVAESQKLDSVGRLAGGIAHDFNNMLGVILGHSELALENDGPAAAVRADLKEIRKAAQRSADLVQQLLTFARQQTVAPRVVSLNETVANLLILLRRLIGEDIQLDWSPATDLWPVMVDTGQIDQLLVNLCSNARDAIAGVGRIRIETANVVLDEAYCTAHVGAVPGKYATIAVSDSGHGMDAQVQERLFEPFFTTKSTGRGTGLGLATVYGTVKQNHGHIEVASTPNAGATFRVYLPHHAGPERAPRVEPVATTHQGGHETILVVEDEPMLRDLNGRMLELLGYEVLLAETPDAAIQLAQENAAKIDLLLTDVVMPQMDGRELSRHLQDLYPDLRVLYMSGYTSNVIALHGVLDEDVDFIAKPFSKQELGAKLREALDRSS